MPSTLPISGPHQFSASSSDPEAIKANTLVFIAERMAGIEWFLGEINDKMFKNQATLTAIAQKMK
jgi:hypothetical protein